MVSKNQIKQVPFFRPSITEAEIDEVVACLRSGWLTTGPRTREFEQQFAAAIRAKHAIAVNSCTAALHLAVEALQLKSGQGVLVPTLTFAATAEIVRYQGAVPILVDCDPVNLNMDLADAARKLAMLRSNQLPVDPDLQVVGIIPVHVGGYMMDMFDVQAFARQENLWVVEDAAHAFPAAWSRGSDIEQQYCGESTADVTCFSFYTNKTMTTGEGGMAVTPDFDLAERMRQMSLHGLSKDAWTRYSGGNTWDYRIVAPGFKYNFTDIAASLGIHQLKRAEAMRQKRQELAKAYFERLQEVVEVDLPHCDASRHHAWHLFPIRLKLDLLEIDRNEFFQSLREVGIGCSVHWRPLHLHPYYEESFGWLPTHFPVASGEWMRLISLPLFPDMEIEDIDYVADAVRGLCKRYAKC